MMSVSWLAPPGLRQIKTSSVKKFEETDKNYQNQTHLQ